MRDMATSIIKRGATETLTVTIADNFALSSWGFARAVRIGNIVIVSASGLHPTKNISGDTTCLTIAGVTAKTGVMSIGLGGNNNGLCTVSIFSGGTVKMNFCNANSDTFFELVFATT